MSNTLVEIESIEMHSANGGFVPSEVKIQTLPDKFKAIAYKYDEDSSGSLDAEEMVNIMRDFVLAEERAQKSAKQVIFLALFNVFQLVCIFGLVICAIILSKDTSMSDSGNLTIKGTDDIVGTRSVEEIVPKWTEMTDSQLNGVSSFTFVNDDSTLFLKSIGIQKIESTGEVLVHIAPMRIGAKIFVAMHAKVGVATEEDPNETLMMLTEMEVIAKTQQAAYQRMLSETSRTPRDLDFLKSRAPLSETLTSKTPRKKNPLILLPIFTVARVARTRGPIAHGTKDTRSELVPEPLTRSGTGVY